MDVTNNGRPSGALTAVMFVAGIALAGFTTYEATVNTVNARIAVLESKQQDTAQRLIRIEDKLDSLLALSR